MFKMPERGFRLLRAQSLCGMRDPEVTEWRGYAAKFRACRGAIQIARPFQPRNGSWTGASVGFLAPLARRDDAADCILQGGATTPEGLKSVQSHLVRCHLLFHQGQS